MSTSTSMPSSGSLRRSPYQGLIPYGEDDAPYFFGREKEARLIAANLFASPLTLLYGASGVGKSSVLRAGVAHQLRRRDDLLVVVFNSWQRNPVGDLMQAVAAAADLADHNGGDTTMHRPTRDPRASLVEFLATCAERLNRRLMIILDQFEEYFLYHAQNEEFATEFPKAVRQSDAPVSFLISIREDFYAKLDRFEGTVPALYDNYLRLEHLDREAAQVAIEKPIEQYNRRYAKAARPFSIEPELVEAVLRQVETGQVILGESGRGVVEATKSHEDAEARIETPFLQLVMTRLWDEEVGERSHNLRLQTLSHLGGAENIVRSHLDAVMSALLPREQEIAASVFHYLVTPSGTKIAYSASDLAGSAELDEPEVVSVLERLSNGDIRILRPVDPPIDRPTALRYEIFHDVLAPAILTWRTGYVQAQERAEAQRRAEEQQREAEEQARAGEQTRVAGRLRRLSVALAGVTLLVLGFAAYAMTLRAQALASAEKANHARNDAVAAAEEADKQKATAEKQSKRADHEKVIAEGKATEAENARAEADAQRGIAIAEGEWANHEAAIATCRELTAAAAGNLNSDPELSVLLGIEALSKLSGHPVRETNEKEAKSLLHQAIQTSRVRLTLPVGQSENPDLANTAPIDVHFSSDEKRVVIVSRNGMATVWDAVTGKKSLVLSGVLEQVAVTAFSPDGSWFAAAGPGPADKSSADKSSPASRTKVLLWDLSTGKHINVACDSRLGRIWNLSFINAGTLVVGGEAGHTDSETGSVTLQLWDIAKDRSIEFYDLNNGSATTSPNRVAFSSDAKRILTHGESDEATVWEAASRRVLWTTKATTDVALSPDGKLVAGVMPIGHGVELKVWEVDSGQEVRSFCSPECGGCPGLFEKPAFSPDGKNLAASASESGIVRLWQVASGRALITTSGFYSRNEVALATTTFSLNGRRRLQHPTFSFSADGRLFAAYSGFGTVKVWSASSGTEYSTVAGNKGFVTCMAFSPSGQHLITGSEDGMARVWDTSRSHEVFTISKLGNVPGA
ncbi:MAG TPA: AAA family ATPase, partial [Blastocatellia bacterium]|nr:AAA family ATPase [Blastocatellia bacterium]